MINERIDRVAMVYRGIIYELHIIERPTISKCNFCDLHHRCNGEYFSCLDADVNRVFPFKNVRNNSAVWKEAK